MSKVLLKKLGNSIRKHRRLKGYSQEKLGELSDLTYNSVGMIERGEVNVPILTLNRIYKALDIKLSNYFENI